MDPGQRLTAHHKDRLTDYLSGYMRGSHRKCDTELLTIEGIKFARDSGGGYGAKPFGPVMSLIEEVARELVAKQEE